MQMVEGFIVSMDLPGNEYFLRLEIERFIPYADDNRDGITSSIDEYYCRLSGSLDQTDCRLLDEWLDRFKRDNVWQSSLGGNEICNLRFSWRGFEIPAETVNDPEILRSRRILASINEFKAALADEFNPPDRYFPFLVLEAVRKQAEAIRTSRIENIVVGSPIDLENADTSSDSNEEPFSLNIIFDKSKAKELLQTILELPPPQCGKKGDENWVHCGEVAKKYGISTKSLATYRNKDTIAKYSVKQCGENENDNDSDILIAGVDNKGRAWRKARAGAHVFYYRPSVNMVLETEDSDPETIDSDSPEL